MQRLRLIPRTALWLVELAMGVLGVGLIITGVNMFFVEGDGDGFMNGILMMPIMLILIYLACCVVVFVGYILNFLTAYDDFDYFGDMWSSLGIAPLYVIRFIFTHFFRNIKLLFTGDPD